MGCDGLAYPLGCGLSQSGGRESTLCENYKKPSPPLNFNCFESLARKLRPTQLQPYVILPAPAVSLPIASGLPHLSSACQSAISLPAQPRLHFLSALLFRYQPHLRLVPPTARGVTPQSIGPRRRLLDDRLPTSSQGSSPPSDTQPPACPSLSSPIAASQVTVSSSP